LVEFPVVEHDLHVQRGSVSDVPLQALLLGIIGLLETIIQTELLVQLLIKARKVKFQIPAVAGDG
jgi:hypothetical protein